MVFQKTERILVAPEQNAIHVQFAHTIHSNAVHPLQHPHAAELLQHYAIQRLTVSFGNQPTSQHPMVPFEEALPAGPSGLLVQVEFADIPTTASFRLERFQAVLRELCGIRRLVAAPLGTSVTNDRLHRFVKVSGRTYAISLTMEGAHSMMSAEFLKDFVTVDTKNRNGIFTVAEPHVWSSWLLGNVPDTIPTTRDSMNARPPARPRLSFHRRSLGFEWTAHGETCFQNDDHYSKSECEIKTFKYISYSVLRKADMSLQDLLPGQTDATLNVDPFADKSLFETIHDRLSCMGDANSIPIAALNDINLFECKIPETNALTQPVHKVASHLYRRHAHSGTFQVTLVNEGASECHIQLEQTLPRVLRPMWSSLQMLQVSSGSDAATESMSLPWQDSNLVEYRPDGGYDISFAHTMPPLTSLMLSIDYEPVFLSIEEFPGDANRGFELAPAQARFECDRSNHTLYSNAMLFHSPLPDMSMPFNVMSMTCTLYAFVIGGLINLLIKKANKQVKDTLDPDNAEPDGLVFKLLWKLKRLIQKYRAKDAAKTVLSEETQETLRATAAQKLLELEKLANNDDSVSSWIQNSWTNRDRSDCCRFFDAAGFIRIPEFVDTSTCESMKSCMSRLVEDWDPSDSLESFATSSTANVKRGDYFLESADRIHFFCEASAIEEKTNTLKPEYQSDKLQSLNKVGHGLHLDPDLVFHQYCKSDAIKKLVLELGWEDPVVPQSMYIFKNPRTGSVVNSHQDSTFLYTTPKQSCLGLWLALDDANLSNGCLWVRPRSHREGVRRHYQRNRDYFEKTIVGEQTESDIPKFVMKDLPTETTIPWDGDLPQNGWQGLLNAGFIPIECKAGDLLVFCGELDHLSLPNYSDQQRHTFQLHLIDGTTKWSPLNWLQTKRPFLRLRDP